MTNRIRAAFAAALLTVCALLQTGCAATPDPEVIPLYVGSTEKTVTLRWDAVEGSDRCRIFRRNPDSGEFRFLDDVTDSLSYTDKYVESGKKYSYKIKVYGGSVQLAQGLSSPVSLALSPGITFIRQMTEDVFEVEWDNGDQECVVYGENSLGWSEIGRSSVGRLRFKNTSGCTALAVSSTGADAVRSEAVRFCGSGTVEAVTALDGWTNAVELEVPGGEWKFEIARSQTRDGEYTVVGSSEVGVFYDVSETEYTSPCWYRFRSLGERFEGAWCEPVQTGTNKRSVFYVPVLMYHDFMPEEEIDGTVEFLDDLITPVEFENDLIWLRDHGYTAITGAELVAYLEGGGTLPQKPVILSIDDGKYGVYKWAWPLLQKYAMKASLSVIGSMIDSASEDPEARKDTKEPFCTWDEIKEMSASGAVEIVSHTQDLHAFKRNGRQGADCAPEETWEEYLPVARADANKIIGKIKEVTGSDAPALAYPYSIRSERSDKAWFAAGYKLLYCGNKENVRHSKWNSMIREAGLNETSALLRRIGRIGGVTIETYLGEYERMLADSVSGHGGEDSYL